MVELAPAIELALGGGPVALPAPAVVVVLVPEVGPLEDMVIAEFRFRGVGWRYVVPLEALPVAQ